MRRFIKVQRLFRIQNNKFSSSVLGYQENLQEYTYQLKPQKQFPLIQTFRVIDLQGNVVSKEHDNLPLTTLVKIYDLMVRIDEMDQILYMSQRQGKISFYMTSFGETAVTLGTAAALHDSDVIYTQYREIGTFVWRGITVQEIVDQLMGNEGDLGKGRQMPMHFGSREHNMPTISSPLTTQVPQASGAGYGFRVGNEPRVAVAFFGEGAASEGDFHSALNFAATLKSQTLFICRNNHYAISTATEDQFIGDIASRGPSYGINTLKVDGNDTLAVTQSVKYARQWILDNKAPFLIEFMTYRVGDHSTSDHSVLYRSQEEIDHWKNSNNPINRLGSYLKNSGVILNENLRKQMREEVIQALKQGGQKLSPPISDLFNDVYDQPTSNLIEQRQELQDHLLKYQKYYDLSKYKQQ